MKKAAALLLSLCLVLSAACTSGTAAAAAAPPAPAAASAMPTPTEAPHGFVVTVADEGGDPIPGAAIALTDRISLKTEASSTGADGTANLGDAAPGKYFLTVSASGYLDAKQDVDFNGGYLPLAVTLKRGPAVKRYLMTLTAVSSADQRSRVYLAQSDDGLNWEPFPGFEPFEDTGGAGVAMKDGLILIATESAIRRYDTRSGAWDAARPYTLHTDGYFNGKGAASFTALTREPSFYRGEDGGLALVGAQLRDQLHAYADDGYALKSDETVNLVGSAGERSGSGGLIYYYPQERYLYKEKFKIGQFDQKDLSDPFVVAAPDAYYLLFSKPMGIAAMRRADGAKGYEAVPGLPGGLIYAGANSGATGYYDAGLNKIVLLVATNADSKPALSRYEAGSLAAAITQKTADIDLSFLGEAPSSVAFPSIWDTAAFPEEPKPQEAKPIGYAAGWFAGNAFVKEESGGTQTGASGSDVSCKLTFSKKTYWVYDYQEAVFGAFTCALDVKPGTNTAAEGLAYCWNPAGASVGGYVFAVDGKTWSLMLFEPTAGATGLAISPVKRMAVLASGDCPASATGCTLTVRYGMGLHELYIDGKKVGEYREAADEKGFAAGFVGVYAASAGSDAAIEFTPVRMLAR